MVFVREPYCILNLKMGKSKTITGIVVYKNLGTSFWGIEGLQGEQWLPVNLPKNLEQEGKRVTLTIRELEGESMFMWGTMVEILSE